MKETPLPPSLEYERGYLDGLRADRTWVGLTDEEIMVCGGMDDADTWAFEFAYAIEAKLKEKNT